MRPLRPTMLMLVAIAASLSTPLAAAELDPASSERIGWNEMVMDAERQTDLGTALASGDFNCDGRVDLAIGAPRRGTISTPLSGAVFVRFTEVSPAPQILISPIGAEAAAFFGASLAAGDLDGDGCHDLVVGATGAALSGLAFYFRGSATGLAPAAHATPLSNEPGQHFGWKVAIVPQGAGSPVVAVSAPDLPRSGQLAVGVVYFYADPLGANTRLDPQECTLEPVAVARCGEALAVGVLSGVPALFAGAPGANTITAFQPVASDQVDRKILPAPADEGYFEFGSSFAAANVDAIGGSELVVGQPSATVGGRPFAGRLALLRIAQFAGGEPFLRTMWNRHQGELGFSAESFDRFGSMVARFDLDGNALEDIVVGAEKEAFGSGPATGGVLVLRSNGDLVATQFLRPAALGLTEEETLSFGGAGGGVASLPSRVATGNDLVVGVPRAVRDPLFGIEGVVVRVPQRATILFGDGFESGNCDAWSDIVP